MHPEKPSRTAQRVAERRAAHQLLDKPLVFDDPLAVRIIGARAEANLPEQPKNFVAARFRAYMAARSRFAEDELRAAVARGIRQYVVLGAGLDTFAYRNPFPDLKVFEVDHPATQAWKRRRLAQVGIQVPSSMTFAPVDFERETFDVGLRRVGFNEEQPTFFSWLGVTMYLDNEIVLGTFRAIREMNAWNGVAFDYAVPRETLGLVGRLALDAVSRRVKKAGEPFRGFFAPAALVAKMRAMGYSQIEDLGSAEIDARYFSGRTDKLRSGSQIGRLMSARG
ncbi:MAG TPA: class I SAM-dependent methyltransferase [Gemmatimonadaceae bacterium]|nr:class I SAM-dependent methyltransferase [Gemmatimonadaceae bacterium]